MPNKPSIDLLWFKRDLRLRDHAPLQAAIARGQRAPKRPLLLLYCFEPSLIADPNYELRHWRFVQECLTDLQQQLATLPSPPAPQSQPLPLVHEWLPFVFEEVEQDDSPSQRVHPPCGSFTGKSSMCSPPC